MHHIVISGNCNCGLSNLMKVIIKQFYEKEKAKIVLFDNGTDELASVQNISNMYIVSASGLDDYIESLARELKERKDMLERGEAEFETILLAIEGYKNMYEAIEDKTANRLSALVRMGKGLKVYLVVSEKAENMSMLCAQEPIMRTMVEEGTGILVGGSFYSHTVFKSNLKYTEANEELGEFEAYMVNNGTACRFKIMHEF